MPNECQKPAGFLQVFYPKRFGYNQSYNHDPKISVEKKHLKHQRKFLPSVGSQAAPHPLEGARPTLPHGKMSSSALKKKPAWGGVG